MLKSRAAFFVLMLFFVSAFSNVSAEITVATAANMRFAMEELRTWFTQHTTIKVNAIYGSSGKLTAQIKNGAPYDIFVAADMGYPDTLFSWGLAQAKPRPYALGALVLWTTREINLKQGLSILADKNIRSIAVADVKSTAYGPAAITALKKSGTYNALQNKLVFGENISQVGQYIVSQSADVGICAKSIAVAKQMQGKGVWVEIDRSLYAPIEQGAVIISHGKQPVSSETLKFYSFLYSNDAQIILVRYGYTIPKL